MSREPIYDEPEPEWMNDPRVRDSISASTGRLAWHGFALLAPVAGLVWPGGASAYLEEKRAPLRPDPFGMDMLDGRES